MLNPIKHKFIYSCSEMWLTAQFNTDVDVKKKINVQKLEHNSFKILHRNNVILSFIIFSITFCKETILI